MFALFVKTLLLLLVPHLQPTPCDIKRSADHSAKAKHFIARGFFLMSQKLNFLMSPITNYLNVTKSEVSNAKKTIFLISQKVSILMSQKLRFSMSQRLSFLMWQKRIILMSEKVNLLMSRLKCSRWSWVWINNLSQILNFTTLSTSYINILIA